MPVYGELNVEFVVDLVPACSACMILRPDAGYTLLILNITDDTLCLIQCMGGIFAS
jgi:hypothetical protein